MKDAQSQFLLANDAIARALGKATSEELLGKTDFDFHPKDLAEKYYADEQKIMASGEQLLNHEKPVVDQATGTRKWLLSTKVPLRDRQGNIVEFVGLNRDITDRKQAEEELEKLNAELAQWIKERTAEVKAL